MGSITAVSERAGIQTRNKMLESELMPWGECRNRRVGMGVGLKEWLGVSWSFRQRFPFCPSWANSVPSSLAAAWERHSGPFPLLSSSPLSLDSGSISESDFTWPRPFCANCKALFFVIIIFFGIQKSLDRKIGAGGWRNLFPSPCESHYRAVRDRAHACVRTDGPTPFPAPWKSASSCQPGAGPAEVMQTRPHGEAFFNQGSCPPSPNPLPSGACSFTWGGGSFMVAANTAGVRAWCSRLRSEESFLAGSGPSGLVWTCS